MKHSIRLKITLLLTASIVLTIFASWMINKSFLTLYYQYSKVKALDETYTELNNIFNNIDENGSLSESDAIRIGQLGFKNNLIMWIYTGSPDPITNGSKTDVKRIEKSMLAYFGGFSNYEGINVLDHIKVKEGAYDIYKQYDMLMDSNSIDLLGKLDSGYIVFFRTNFQNLQDNVAISNKFLSYVGIFVTILGTAAMFIISRRFTRPILELSEIAKKMSDLDFDVKYEVKTQDEIGLLGTSINTLSERLEQTISELKSANNELQSDIDNKIQIDEMRKDFLSNVTHELKTPIALIQGYAEGLKENISDDQESRDFYCEVIIDEAMKMNNMVKKLLSLNQIEFGNNQVEFERFDIVALIQSVLNSTDILIKQKNITVIFDEKEPVYVWADEYMIEEVVTNYISNAIHHVSGANIIEVKLIRINDLVRIAVYNTGANIPEEDLDKIWIKFYKVDKARTREYGGSGIGLSIVKAIMTSHNRECGVVNHQSGVEFWFELDAKS
ncbi:sensor histidine kinase [Clostridium sp. Marseille-P299]|uniref:sensor histidine kinase n=1 Tax=Clostridium sp. Marseille-P299 TaxID=1805477 RepID=UPI00082DDDCD|nr:HAMP domain-containing sensor histidine kinase [Clostridium sp. Marseille-P299]